MAVGTSSGEYYNDMMDMISKGYHPKGDDNNVITPETTPDLDPNDPMELPNKLHPPKEIPVGGSADYDYDAWRKANPDTEMKPGQHYPDTYKLPNHMTFSDESMYHGKNGEEGGHWEDLGNDKWSFTAGPSNLKYHTREELRNYFNEVEPGNKLIIPSDVEDRRNEPNTIDWKGIGQSIYNTGHDLVHTTVDSLLPQSVVDRIDPEKGVTETPLGKQLGLNDIHIDRQVDPSMLDQFIGTVQDDAHILSKTFEGPKERFMIDNERFNYDDMRKSSNVEDRTNQKLSTKEMDELEKKDKAAGLGPSQWWLKDTPTAPESDMSRQLGSSDIELRRSLLAEGQRRLLKEHAEALAHK